MRTYITMAVNITLILAAIVVESYCVNNKNFFDRLL